MSFVERFASMLERVDGEYLKIHEERCICVRNKNAGCMRCAEVCTSGCISVEDGCITVDAEKCIGCGTCATACPTCAIEMCCPTDRAITEQLKNSIVATQGHPVVACERALAWERRIAKQARASLPLTQRMKAPEAPYNDEAVCQPVCLGRVEESLLLTAAAFRAEDVTLVCHDCASCRYGSGGELCRKVVTSAANMLEACGSPCKLRFSEELPAQARAGSGTSTAAGAYDESRRAALEDAKAAGFDYVATTVHEKMQALGLENAPTNSTPQIEKVGVNGTLSHHVPTRRTAVFNCLTHLGTPVAERMRTRIVGTIDIDTSRCSSCRMCAVFCPSGAISKLDDEAGHFGIIHRPTICMQCCCCENICPQGAITVRDEVPLGEFLGKEAVGYLMKKPQWEPNKPDSLYNKFHSVIGEELEMCSF